MAKGQKTGGRKAGTPNKRTAMMLEAIDKASKLEAQGDLDGLTRVFVSMIRRANGVLVEREINGVPVVYQEAPDPSAAKVALSYAFGNPKETVELDVAPGDNPDEGVVFAVPTFIIRKAKKT